MFKKLFSGNIKEREISFINMYCYHKNQDIKLFEEECINITNQIINFLAPDINNIEGFWNTVKELVQNGIRPTYEIFKEIEPEKDHNNCRKCGQLRFGTKTKVNAGDREVIFYLKNKAPRSEHALSVIANKLNAGKDILFQENTGSSTGGAGLGIYLVKKFASTLSGKLKIYWENGFYIAEIIFKLDKQIPAIPAVQEQAVNARNYYSRAKLQLLRRIMG